MTAVLVLLAWPGWVDGPTVQAASQCSQIVGDADRHAKYKQVSCYGLGLSELATDHRNPNITTVAVDVRGSLEIKVKQLLRMRMVELIKESSQLDSSDLDKYNRLRANLWEEFAYISLLDSVADDALTITLDSISKKQADRTYTIEEIRARLDGVHGGTKRYKISLPGHDHDCEFELSTTCAVSRIDNDLQPPTGKAYLGLTVKIRNGFRNGKETFNISPEDSFTIPCLKHAQWAYSLNNVLKKRESGR